MQQIYRRTPMSKCEFGMGIYMGIYMGKNSAWVFSCKFAAYFQNTFSGRLLLVFEQVINPILFLELEFLPQRQSPLSKIKHCFGTKNTRKTTFVSLNSLGRKPFGSYYKITYFIFYENHGKVTVTVRPSNQKILKPGDLILSTLKNREISL